jgi:hypothetical protein
MLPPSGEEDSKIGQFATKKTIKKADAQTAHLQFAQADTQTRNCKKAVSCPPTKFVVILCKLKAFKRNKKIVKQQC